MSLTQNISLWHEKPDLQGIENLVATILREAVEAAGGICEAQAHRYELALPENIKLEHGMFQLDRVTPFAEHASNDLPHIGLSHPLILGFADQVLNAIPIDIIELSPYRETPPQRIVEKLSSMLTFRPAKIELSGLERSSRLWIHSVYWIGFESFNFGNRLKHLLHDHDGHFIGNPEDYLKRLNLRMSEFEIHAHSRIPANLSSSLQTVVSAKVFEEEFKTDISRVQNEELAKAINYYDRLESDLHQRLNQEIQKGAKPNAIELLKTKKEAVRTERDIRLKNILERFRAQFRIQPVGGRILILPTYQCTLKPNATSRASIRIPYCPVLREFLLPLCPSCRQTSRDMTLREEQYFCPKCF